MFTRGIIKAPHKKHLKALLPLLNSSLRTPAGNGTVCFFSERLTGNDSYYYQLLRHRRRMVRGPDPIESPRLTPQMVSSILQTNEVSANFTSGVVKDLHCNELQANKPIEDRRVEGKIRGTEKYLFGVFDGHAGCACAQNLKERLFQYIAVSMADTDTLYNVSQGGMKEAILLIEDLATSFRDNVSPDLASLHWQSLLSYIDDTLITYEMETSVEDKLTNAFIQLDQDMSLEAMCQTSDRGLSSDAINIAFSGAVGCAVFIDGLDVYVANVGDAQAVLGSYIVNNEIWEATLMTNKHDADNQAEVKNLFQRHPNESVNILKGGRLFGELMPLRAFGDVRYKWEEKDFNHLKEIIAADHDPDLAYFKHLSLPKNYRTPPYLHATPEITHHRLSPKDRFLVIASDGLWDSEGMTPQGVISLVGNHTEGHQTLSQYQFKEGTSLKAMRDELSIRRQNLAKRTVDKNSATHLLRHSLGLEHGHLSAQLTLPQHLVRFYRDDITITVIYFDTEYIKNYTRVHQNNTPLL